VYATDAMKTIKGGRGSREVCGVVVDKKSGGGYYRVDDGPMVGTGSQETESYTMLQIADDQTFWIFGALVGIYVRYK
jgi:hypothetical protein